MQRDSGPVENPMVLGPYYREGPPAWTCPHCGEEWYGYRDPNFRSLRFEGTALRSWQPLSATGRYCAACVGEAFGTDQALGEWFAREGDCRDFLPFFLGQKPSLWDRPGREEAELLAALLRDHEPERFYEALGRWVLGCRTGGPYEAFQDWLMREK